MYLAFCYNVKPRMMNNILFTTKTNKQKNIENAVIYCIHIPLSQLITVDCTIQEGKWGNSVIVTRYRLDSQFHCSYLESRGVPGKTREKTREIISLLFPVHDFRWRHFRWCSFRWCNFWWCHIRWCNFRWRHIRWCNFRWRHCSTLLHLKCGLSCAYILLRLLYVLYWFALIFDGKTYMNH